MSAIGGWTSDARSLLSGSAARFVPPSERVLMVRRPSVWWVLMHRWRLVVAPAVALVVVDLLWSRVIGGRPGVPLSALAVLWVLVVLWVQVLACLSRMYVLTDRRMIVVAGIVVRDVGDVPLERIQHEVVTQRWWERLLGLGTVGVATAGGDGPVLRWLSVPRPERVLAAIRGAVERARKPREYGLMEGQATRGPADPEAASEVPSQEPLSAIVRVESASAPAAGEVVIEASAAEPQGGAKGRDAVGSRASSDSGNAAGGAAEVAWFPVIGIAGGIGSGKSAASRAFERLGCVVIDSDREARAALDRDEVRRQLVEWWGPSIVGADGRVDRRRVADIVFGNAVERRRLEELVHPLVRARRSELKERARGAGAVGVVVDAPLLFEAGVDAECDAVVFVDAPREQRVARVRETRGWDEGELDRRESSQMPLEEKRARSNLVVRNDGDLASLEAAVEQALRTVRSWRPGVGS